MRSCWLQVMKMVMTLLAPADGLVHFQQLEGSLLSAGDLIARLELDNPAAAQQITPYTGGFPELGPPLVHSSKVDQRFKAALASAKNVLQGAHQMRGRSNTSSAGSSPGFKLLYCCWRYRLHRHLHCSGRKCGSLGRKAMVDSNRSLICSSCVYCASLATWMLMCFIPWQATSILWTRWSTTCLCAWTTPPWQCCSGTRSSQLLRSAASEVSNEHTADGHSVQFSAYGRDCMKWAMAATQQAPLQFSVCLTAWPGHRQPSRLLS